MQETREATCPAGRQAAAMALWASNLGGIVAFVLSSAPVTSDSVVSGLWKQVEVVVSRSNVPMNFLGQEFGERTHGGR